MGSAAKMYHVKVCSLDLRSLNMVKVHNFKRKSRLMLFNDDVGMQFYSGNVLN